MNGFPESYDPLEQWKEDYNRDGTGSLETLYRLAHMSRFLANYQSRSVDAHLVLFGLTRDAACLYRAIQVAGSGSSSSPGQLDIVNDAIRLYTAALERTEPGTRWHLALRRGQASVFYTRADATSLADDWRLVIDALAGLLKALPAGDADRPNIIAALGDARRQLAKLTGSTEDLIAALADFEEAAAAFPPAREGYALLLINAARTASDVATITEDPERLSRALALFERAAAVDAQTRSVVVDDVTRLAYHLFLHWQELHADTDLEQCLDGWRTTVRVSAGSADWLAQSLNNLVATVQEARERREAPALLDEQVVALERLVTLIPDGDPMHPKYLLGLADSYRDRFRVGHERADIDADIDRLERSIAGSPPTDRRSLTIKLGRFLRERYDGDGELADIDAAVAFWRGQLDATRVTDPDQAEWVGAVAGTWLDRYDRSRRPADLDAAVDTVDQARRALEGRPISAVHEQRLGELEAVVVRERYRQLGRAADLDRLLTRSGRALGDPALGGAERTARASEHAFLLLRRFDRAGDQADLNEAITALDESAPYDEPGATPDATRGRWLTLLGESLLKRYGLWGIGQLDELARSRDCFERAVPLTEPGTPARADALLGLASATEQLFQLTPVPLESRNLPISLIEQALEQVADDDAYSSFIRQTLGQSLLQRAAGGRQRPEDLDRAIELLERAAASGRTGFEEAGARADLADALRRRYQLGGHGPDRERAIAEYRASLPQRLETNADQVVTAAARWGAWAAEQESWTEAAEAFMLATAALEEIYLANVGSGSTVWLRRAAGLPAEAAYALARVGRAGDCALQLEAARFRAGSEWLALVHADLNALDYAGHADLADQLRKAATRWQRESRFADTAPPTARAVSMSFSFETLRAAAGETDEAPSVPADPPARQSSDVDRGGWQAGSRRTKQAREKFEEAVRAIRAVDGFERFLDRPTLADITAISNRLPVVYLASCALGGLAVAFGPGGTAGSAFLPSLGRARLETEVTAFQEAYQSRETDDARWREQLAATTRWLWDAAMAPTLPLLGKSGSLLLIPTGALGVLPLHAAWRPDSSAPTGRRYAGDDVVVGYAPNARSASGEPGEVDGGLLAVEDPAPRPASVPPLAFADPEVAAAAAYYPEATILRHEEATVERVRCGMRAASVYHLACHGRIDLREPRRSALLLANGQPLTLQDLLELRLDGRADRRAVLTACETALAGAALPDEVISLPGALLQAGFTGTVATQWAVAGLPTAFLVARFYQHWKHDGWDWATALAAAQRWLRDSTDGEKAEFTHLRTGSPLLPIGTRRPLWRAMASRDPAGRSFADIAEWSAYTYLGSMAAPGRTDTKEQTGGDAHG